MPEPRTFRALNNTINDYPHLFQKQYPPPLTCNINNAIGWSYIYQVYLRQQDEGWVYGPVFCRAINSKGTSQLEMSFEQASKYSLTTL